MQQQPVLHILSSIKEEYASQLIESMQLRHSAKY